MKKRISEFQQNPTLPRIILLKSSKEPRKFTQHHLMIYCKKDDDALHCVLACLAPCLPSLRHIKMHLDTDAQLQISTDPGGAVRVDLMGKHELLHFPSL